MKIQVCSLTIALAIAVPIAVSTTEKSSAAPINGTSIKAAVPAATTDVRYRERRDRGTRDVQRTPNDYPYASYWAIPPIIRTGAIRPIIHIGAIRPITIPTSLTAGVATTGGDTKLGSVRLPRTAASQHVFERF
jgi:hypothetical protein